MLSDPQSQAHRTAILRAVVAAMAAIGAVGSILCWLAPPIRTVAADIASGLVVLGAVVVGYITLVRNFDGD